MSTTSFLLPSHFGSPFLTTVSDIKYDAKGRQMSYNETEVQRLERMAFINASKSRSSSPVDSLHSGNSSPATPTRKLISEPYGDPIELMANRLAAEFAFGSDDFSSSSDEEQQVLYSTPRTTQRAPAVSFAPIPKVPSTFRPGHRRKRSSLSSIPEED